MGRPKALILSMVVDRAGASHNCRFNEKHRIQKGALRLKVREGRSYLHYCPECGSRFLEAAIDQAEKLRESLRAP